METTRITAWQPDVPGVSEVLHADFGDHAYPMHSHGAWTLLMVDRGTVLYDLGRDTHATKPGSLCVLPPDVSHDGRAATVAGFRKRVVYLERAALDDRLIGRAVDTPAILDARLAERMGALHAALLTRAEPLEAESRLALIVTRISSVLGGNEGPPPSASARLARDLRELLDARIETGVSLAEAARTLSSSSARLVRSFNTAYGIPPHHYLTGRRVELARRHLLAGRTAADAAVLAGFYDQSHLTRHFKRMLGVPPAAYAGSRTAS